MDLGKRDIKLDKGKLINTGAFFHDALFHSVPRTSENNEANMLLLAWSLEAGTMLKVMSHFK